MIERATHGPITGSAGVSAVVISAAAALVGVLLGQVLARSGEYRKWLRAERHRSATELLAAGEAVRRHSAARVLALASGGSLPAGESETHLGDLERLDLAVEGCLYGVPRRVAALAEDLGATVTAITAVGLRERVAMLAEDLGVDNPIPGEQPPGDTYRAARIRFTDAARRMIAPGPRDQIKSLLGGVIDHARALGNSARRAMGSFRRAWPPSRGAPARGSRGDGYHVAPASATARFRPLSQVNAGDSGRLHRCRQPPCGGS